MKRETENWLKIAKEDLACAKILFPEHFLRMVCFHSQQAVEKALKALLVEKKVKFKRVHNLIDLKNGIEKLGYKVFLDDEEAVFLNSVYRMRYPVDLGLLPWGEPVKKDAQQALKIARRVLKQVLLLINKSDK